MKKKELKCPICKGKGTIDIPNKLNPYFNIQVDAKYIAKSLRAEKYSYREIARIMGYNNPQSIKNLIEST